MSYLKFTNVNKIYPNGFQAVYDFNLEIEQGDFVALLGPSGCGKTTTLRMLAGLEAVTTGEIALEERKINNIPSQDRDVGMVFQDYALYPHLTVYKNIGFSLMIRRTNKDIIHQRVMAAAELLGLTPFLKRRPAQLSGGQRQRVALGRTIVRQPKLFLMDEPMSNLDAKLRNEMRVELVELHRKLSATTIYVTHDQVEAMTMANVIVVMSHGRIQQIGDSISIYDAPENLFVAEFIGVPSITIIEGRLEKNRFIAPGISMVIPEKRMALLKEYDQKNIVIGIRPETFSLADEKDKDAAVEMTELLVVEAMGDEYFLHAQIGEKSMTARVRNDRPVEMGTKVKFNVNAEKVHFFDVESTMRIKA